MTHIGHKPFPAYSCTDTSVPFGEDLNTIDCLYLLVASKFEQQDTFSDTYKFTDKNHVTQDVRLSWDMQ